MPLAPRLAAMRIGRSVTVKVSATSRIGIEEAT